MPDEVPLTRGQRVARWLTRGKLWDDVFTRTIANVLSVLILGMLAIALGVVSVDPGFWLRVLLTCLLTVGFVGMCLNAWRLTPGNDKGNPARWVVVYGLLFGLTVVATVWGGSALGLD